MGRVIRAAGGLVFRVTPKGRIKVLVVHRPGYDDWGLPKGKGEPGESDADTALREVFEETGYRCRIVAPLPPTRHRANGSIKEVVWYAMRPLPGSPGFKPNEEVDEALWLAPDSALRLLDYTTDEYLVATADFAGLAATGTTRLLRHALAGDRDNWDGDDRVRPLSKKGRRQADLIATDLADAGIDRIVSSPYVRCVETVKPLAKALGLKIETDRRLGEDMASAAALEVVNETMGHNVVLCTHGEQLETILKKMRKLGLELKGKPDISKGSIWEIDVLGGEFTGARYVKPPRV